MRRKTHFSHLKNNKHYNKHLQASYNKYGKENFKFEVIEKCEKEKLNEREIYWISFYDSYKNGYNQTIGGDGNRGYIATEETKKKMRENHADVSGENNPMYGKTVYDFLTEDEVKRWRKNLKGHRAWLGKHHTEETKKKLSNIAKERYSNPNYINPLKGIKYSKERKEQMRKSRIGKYCGKDNPCSKQIICLNTLEIFDAISEACRKYDFSQSSISLCCQGKNNYAGKNKNGTKMIWMYYEDYIKNKSNIKIEDLLYKANNANKGKNNVNARSVICINDCKVFECARVAGEFYNIDNSTIGKCCKGKINHAGKHPKTKEHLKWMYYEDYIELYKKEA